jgi:hypothetical protein
VGAHPLGLVEKGTLIALITEPAADVIKRIEAGTYEYFYPKPGAKK